MNLSIRNISKTYGNGVKALDQINLEIPAGMFGLLGPNGSGKSSLMRTIATLQFPDTGQVLFNDLDVFSNKTEFRKSLGYLPQEFGVYPKETAEGLLKYFATLKGISSKSQRSIAVDRVLAITNLTDAKNKRVSTFSGGMKQRFGIAQLLLNDPKLIIVDEPTEGLDPAERTRFLNVLRNIGSENIVLFSTHLVEDVKDLCKEMAIFDQGKLASQISPKAATEQLKGKVWELQKKGFNAEGLDCFILSESYDEKNQIKLRVVSESCPSDEAISVDPKLEDFYFLTLNQK